MHSLQSSSIREATRSESELTQALLTLIIRVNSLESLQGDAPLVIFHDLVVQDVLDSVIHAIHDDRHHLLGGLRQRQSHIRKYVICC